MFSQTLFESLLAAHWQATPVRAYVSAEGPGEQFLVAIHGEAALSEPFEQEITV